MRNKKLQENISWKKLGNYPANRQMRITAVCFLKTFRHWKSWLAMIFIGMIAYISNKIGVLTGLKYGTINIIGLFGAGIGGLILGIVMNKLALNNLDNVLKSETDQK